MVCWWLSTEPRSASDVAVSADIFWSRSNRTKSAMQTYKYLASLQGIAPFYCFSVALQNIFGSWVTLLTGHHTSFIWIDENLQKVIQHFVSKIIFMIPSNFSQFFICFINIQMFKTVTLTISFCEFSTVASFPTIVEISISRLFQRHLVYCLLKCLV